MDRPLAPWLSGELMDRPLAPWLSGELMDRPLAPWLSSELMDRPLAQLSLVPRPLFPQLRMDYITATWKELFGSDLCQLLCRHKCRHRVIMVTVVRS